MEAGKEIIGRFPIEEIFLVVSYGLFVLISFPFDIFKVKAPPPNTSEIGWWNFLQVFASLVKNNFDPFANVKHLGENFPNYLVEAFLLSLVFGLAVVFLYNQFNYVNHRIRSPFTWMHRKIKTANATKDDEKEKTSLILSEHEELAYANWIRKRGYQKLLDFLYSMDNVATGLLYGVESFSLIVVISLVIIGLNDLQLPKFEWIVLSLALWFPFIALYKAYRRRFDGAKKHLRRAFKNSCSVDKLEEYKRLLDLKVINQKQYDDLAESIVATIKNQANC